ncbi:MAG: ribonuclease III [Bacteroidetes bacterium]|nr:MAG: ribonuclease III [Bacteroidota bacterium]MBL1143799.1 ribonuclease III [Bacteroidota bacterium]MCB0802836.1 ribonuclease III [Flavobacteriales bacterium]NOG56600.1 ribonuclease III [Bacteroidota bacterium]
MSLFKGIRFFLLPDKSKNRTLKNILGFSPSNMALYEQAFTHKSIVNETNEDNKVSNERLEYLGDAILGAIVAEFFFNKYPYQEEGFLTKMRSKLVNRTYLNDLSIDIGLDTFLETSADTSRTKSIFGDAFEALVGAIYLDKGYSTCRKFVINKIIKDYVDVEQLVHMETDFKSKLVEWCQKNKKRFEFIVQELENGNGKYYRCQLMINKQLQTTAEGKSKKLAEQNACSVYFIENSI